MFFSNWHVDKQLMTSKMSHFHLRKLAASYGSNSERT